MTGSSLPNETRKNGGSLLAGMEKKTAFILLMTAIAIICFVRIRLLSFPLERDEGEFAYPAQLLMAGVMPYKMTYDPVKPPGVPMMYALGMSIFGQTAEGIHLMLLLINLATLLLLFAIARPLFGALGAAVTALTFALLCLGQSVLGLAAHATQFVMLFVTGGFLLLLKAKETKGTLLVYLSGLLFGIAIEMRQPAVFFALFGLVNLCKSEDGFDLRGIVRTTSSFCLGAVTPFILICAAMAMAGVFRPFWFWTVTYLFQYGSEIPFSFGCELFRNNASAIVKSNWPLWLLAGAGLFFLFSHRHRFILTSFLVCSFLAICPGLHFREHYFIQLLPAVAMLVGIAISFAVDFAVSSGRSALLTCIPVALFLGAWTLSILHQRELLFVQLPVQACRTIYRGNPFPEAMTIANYVAAHTEPSDRIAVIGSEPEIYFYAHRPCATGYIVTYPLMEPTPQASKMQQEMIAEITNARPKYIMIVGHKTSWLARERSDLAILRWSDEFCRSQYDLEGMIDMTFPEAVEYRWGVEALSFNVRSTDFISVWRRKS